jgi:hypothetical protein
MSQFTISSSIDMNGNEIKQTQYVTNEYLITESDGSFSIYNPKSNLFFEVNQNESKLKPLIIEKLDQVASLKEVISQVVEITEQEFPKEFFGYSAIGRNYFKKLPGFEIDCKSWIGEISGLEKTCWSVGNLVNNQMQFIDFKLNINQMLFEVDSCVFVGEQMMMSKSRIIDIKNSIEEHENFLSFLNFPIVD